MKVCFKNGFYINRKIACGNKTTFANMLIYLTISTFKWSTVYQNYFLIGCRLYFQPCYWCILRQNWPILALNGLFIRTWLIWLITVRLIRTKSIKVSCIWHQADVTPHFFCCHQKSLPIWEDLGGWKKPPNGIF